MVVGDIPRHPTHIQSLLVPLGPHLAVPRYLCEKPAPGSFGINARSPASFVTGTHSAGTSRTPSNPLRSSGWPICHCTTLAALYKSSCSV